jgi:hypothetical protein
VIDHRGGGGIRIAAMISSSSTENGLLRVQRRISHCVQAKVVFTRGELGFRSPARILLGPGLRREPWFTRSRAHFSPHFTKKFW